jgi:hypothetical protein
MNNLEWSKKSGRYNSRERARRSSRRDRRSRSRSGRRRRYNSRSSSRRKYFYFNLVAGEIEEGLEALPTEGPEADPTGDPEADPTEEGLNPDPKGNQSLEVSKILEATLTLKRNRSVRKRKSNFKIIE